MQQRADYPVQFAVDYPDRPLDRLSTAFRLIVAIPIMFVVASVSGGTFRFGEPARVSLISAGGTLFLGPLLMLLFRRKYPRWWFDWNLQLMRFSSRVGAYLALMDDRYPSTDDEQAVHLDFPFPDAPQELNRWLPLIKWFLAIPHYIVLASYVMHQSGGAGRSPLLIGWVRAILAPRGRSGRDLRPPCDLRSLCED